MPITTILLTIVIFWQLVITLILLKFFRAYQTLTSGIDKKDFSSVLLSLKQHAKQSDKHLSNLDSHIDQINTRLQTHIQKMGFVRYNPFGNTGGDQSFCLCLLDENNHGILLTSLHTRQQTRIYTKLISAGKSADSAQLSKEEAQCIKKAINWSQS